MNKTVELQLIDWEWNRLNPLKGIERKVRVEHIISLNNNAQQQPQQ